MTAKRSEADALGTMDIPAGALYGIHTARAVENFPLVRRPVNPRLFRAYATVKLAAADTNHALGCWSADVFAAIERACREMMAGELDAWLVVDALQGGAGTSTNMNVNEVLANRALAHLGLPPGRYDIIHPLDDINRHQSTNDTYPTALRVAAIAGVRELEKSLTRLMEAFQEKERDFSRVVKVGRTELQDAVLTTLGRSMSAYAEAFGRDRWRVFKCEERLRVVNLGGTAIGTGVGAPRRYIFQVTPTLAGLTGYGLSRAENLVEATQNQDALVEVSGILSACATNLVKCGNDLRLLSSGPDAGIGEILLPPRQAGSSIMPGKVNPVIPEAAVQAGLRVMGNHQVLTQACAMGNLELNAFMPLVADALLESIDLLIGATGILESLCVRGMTANAARCAVHVGGATAVLTALVEKIGHDRAEALAEQARATGRPIRELVDEAGLLTAGEFDRMTAADAVMRLGH